MKNMEQRRVQELNYKLPVLEFTGNRRVLTEGSTGVLKYDDELVRLNSRSGVITFKGRGLSIKCISPTCVIVEGFIISVEFTG